MVIEKMTYHICRIYHTTKRENKVYISVLFNFINVKFINGFLFNFKNYMKNFNGILSHIFFLKKLQRLYKHFNTKGIKVSVIKIDYMSW